MGQAFDQDGNVLGEAFGETKRDVFNKLMAEHPDAPEIRIRTLREEAERRLMMPPPNIDVIARVCHEANRAYSLTLKEPSPLAPWDNVEQTYRDSTCAGVRKALNGRDGTPAPRELDAGAHGAGVGPWGGARPAQ